MHQRHAEDAGLRLSGKDDPYLDADVENDIESANIDECTETIVKRNS